MTRGVEQPFPLSSFSARLQVPSESVVSAGGAIGKLPPSVGPRHLVPTQLRQFGLHRPRQPSSIRLQVGCWFLGGRAPCADAVVLALSGGRSCDPPSFFFFLAFSAAPRVPMSRSTGRRSRSLATARRRVSPAGCSAS